MQEVTEPPPVKWPGRLGKKRLTILRASGSRFHRYRIFRAVSISTTLALLALVPLSGIARVDLSTGEHRALFERTDLLQGMIALGVAIFALYFLTFNVNLVAGRMFCGWGCPIGQLNRLTDTCAAQTKPLPRWSWTALMLGFAFLLSLSVLLWWTSFGAMAVAGAVLLTAAAVVFARRWGWSFCRKVCPIGLYYSVVQTPRPLGILHHRSLCLDEGACVRACPVELDARNLLAPKTGIGGFAIEGLPENNHCLRCGACVEACEIVTSKLEAPALSFDRPAPREELIQLPVRSPAPPPPPAPPRSEEKAVPVSRWIQIGVLFAVAASVTSYAAIAAQRTSRYQPQETWSREKRSRVARYAAAAAFEKRTIRGTAPADAIVYLDHPPPGLPLSSPSELELRIHQGAFSTAVIVAHPGDRLELVNDDPILHTVHASAERRSRINAALPPHGKPRRVDVPPAGLYRIACEQHPAETAELLVLDHPYVTRAGADGSYALEDVPAGDVTVVVHGLKEPTP